MNQLSTRRSKAVLEYILSDYHFLNDYEIISSQKTSNTFVANIKNTEQKVRFVKHKYTEELFPRFKAVHSLFKNGIVLADNMFILEECEEFYYYIIEAQIEIQNSRFQTLHHYLYRNDVEEEESKSILGKIKILLDCLHQQGQAFAGLDPRKIIIDDEKHLYLAPFGLQLELKTDNYSRAYYPPQILSKISKEETEISEQMMHKWDVWSFGCISLELMLFSSPAFLTTSLPKQLKQIADFNVNNEVMSLEESVKNIFINSLSKDPSIRTISTTQINKNTLQLQTKELQNMYKETISNITNVKKQEMNTNCQMKELNIHQKQQGNCIFTMNLFCLNNIDFQKELHVSIPIGRTFHFYLDYDQKSPRKYNINRKISVRGHFQQFYKWFSQPISIELKQKDKKCKIIVNAQGLVMIHENQRLWNESIIGNYSSSVKSDFPKARIKLNCSLITPDTITFEDKSVKNKEKEQSEKKQQGKGIVEKVQNSKVKVSVKEQKSVEQRPLQQLSSNNPAKKHKRSKSPQSIPTISQISENLSKLNEQLKRKMKIEQQSKEQDQIKKQLSSLLEIE